MQLHGFITNGDFLATNLNKKLHNFFSGDNTLLNVSNVNVQTFKTFSNIVKFLTYIASQTKINYLTFVAFYHKKLTYQIFSHTLTTFPSSFLALHFLASKY